VGEWGPSMSMAKNICTAIGRLAVLALSVAGCSRGTRPGGFPAPRVPEVEVESATLEFAPDGTGGGFAIQRMADGGAWETVGDVRAGTGTFLDVDLAPGTGYAYRLARVTEAETRVIRGGEEAEFFSVDLAGATRLTLITTDGGDGIGADHAVWGAPVLVRRDGARVPLAGLTPRSFKVGYGTTGKPRAITIGSTTYENSIWAHAVSEMVHDLGGEYARLEAMVGVDAGVKRNGSVAFRARVVTGRCSDPVRVATPALLDSPGHTTYYVDSGSGDDAAAGTSPEAPWKSLARVNRQRFAPGDRILFRAGSRYTGRLKPHGSGAAGAPIVVDRYAGEERPRIDGEGRYLAAVHLLGAGYWRLNRLEVTNAGRERAPYRTGVTVAGVDCGVMRDIRLDGLFVHDVNGSNVKDQGAGFGILWSNGGSRTPSYFDGLVIENCHLVRCDRNGICGWGYWERQDWHPSLNVVIRGNLLEDIGGDCIVPIGTDGCLIERNVVRGGRMRAEDAAAGIWPWACDNTIVQFNEVGGMRGSVDGQGFDSDYNCRNSLFQYNYSHDNDGGFILICNPGSESRYSLGNTGTTVRYNISQNDGTRTIQIGGRTEGTTIHNNVFYVRKGMEPYGIYHNDWGGWSDGVRICNNIFYADGKMRHEFGKSTNSVFLRNVFFGNHENAPKDADAITGDPMLVKPGSGGSGFDSLGGYRLGKGSPCVGAGRPMDPNGPHDFWGGALPGPGQPLDIGAHQSGQPQPARKR